MKKLVLTLIAALTMCGSVFAQRYEQSHWPDFNGNLFENQGGLVAAISINGHVYTVEDEGWDQLEAAAFVGDVCRANNLILTDAYVIEYGDPYPTFDALPIYYTNSGEVVSFKLFDHSTGIEYDNCEITYMDEPMVILTGEEHYEAWLYEPYLPIILNFTSGETQTFTMDITGYGADNYESNLGYYLIASPVVEAITPSEDNGFLTSAYNLYAFDNNFPGEEWQNYEAAAFTLANGMGYLYASQEDTQLSFTGTPYSGDGVIELAYNEDNEYFGGLNLVGNPFTVAASIDRDFYIMNEDGSEVMTEPATGTIAPMTGCFVIAEEEGESVTFTAGESKSSPNLALNLTQGHGVVDRAVVRFGEGRTLPKFQMNPSHTKVYIPQDGNDYAVVRASEMGEMPVNFKAEKNGTYTLNFSNENVEFGYLHLIDNLTGADVDLLDNPSYSFNALTTDYASRFKLVYATGNNTEDNFAFMSNGCLVVSNEGNATLQVVDVNGRILDSQTINGSASVSINAAAGVYVLRLVNGNDVKVQKIVIR